MIHWCVHVIMNADKDMVDVEELNYIPNYQQLLFENSQNVLEISDMKRKCLVQTYSASLLLLNNESALELTKINLEQCVNNENENNANMYENHVTSNIKAQGFRCNLNEVDVKALLKPLPCAVNNSIQCQTTENINENNLHEFMKIFNQSLHVEENYTNELKGKKIAKSFAPRCCAPKSNKIFKTISTPDTSVEHKLMNDLRELEANASAASAFKTAREELNLQSFKKFGTRPVSQNQLGGQKRKLGTRRTFHNKFISPMLTNNGSEEQLSKNDEWLADQEIDERLKNIEPRMVELIRSEIMDTGTPVDWDDIAGLEFAKTAIQEAVVWPLLRPDIFTGLRRPPKGILLFGPPGTGKTLIGKCVASQSKSTFFSISASSLTSKWIGDGEKMVRALFAVARCHQPAVIFIDEIDSLLSQRSETEHESSRRIKTEFLVQLDGAATDSEERILVIGATNRPQELDEAARRRFVKRLYIPLPEFQARLQLVTRLMAPECHSLVDENIQEISRLSDGYSGADMKNLCSEASLGPIRCIDMRMIQSIQSNEVRPVSMEDFMKAFSRVKSSVSPSDLDQYLAWNKTYGSGSAF